MANQNEAQVDRTLSSWGSLERDAGSFMMYYPEPTFPVTQPDLFSIMKCAVYIPLAKMMYFPCKIVIGFPANHQLAEVLQVGLPITNDLPFEVRNALGFVDYGEYSSMRLGVDEIRHIVIKSPYEVEIGFRREMMHGDSKLVIMTHHGDQVERFAQFWLIDNFALTLRWHNDGPIAEMIFGMFLENEVVDLSKDTPLVELEFWHRLGADPFTEIWQARKRTLFRLAHTLVDNEIGGETTNELLAQNFEEALELYLEAPDCSKPCWDDPRQLLAEEVVGYQPHGLQVTVKSEQVQFTIRPMNYEKECHVYLSHQACWYTITYMRFYPANHKVEFYYNEAGQQPIHEMLFDFERQLLYYWKEVCIVDANHYALVLYTHLRYVYIRSVNMAHHLALRDHLIHTFGAYYPTVGAGHGNANDTLMSPLDAVSLGAYRRLWTNPGGVQPDQLFYRTLEKPKRKAHAKNKELVKHDMEQMACRMMDRYAFKLARALLKREWNRTNADANVGPNEPRRILRQLALYKSLLPNMTKWFHHVSECGCDSCTQKENVLRAEHDARGDRDMPFWNETLRQDRFPYFLYRLKLLLDCRIKHAHFAEPDY